MTRVRLAAADEVRLLLDVEHRATARFDDVADLGSIPEDPTPVDELLEAIAKKLCWVAMDAEAVVGYAYASELGDGSLFLEELSVVPEAGRRGIGRALVETVIAAAREHGFVAVTLTTFRDVPWNGPWYARIGFREVSPPERSAALDEAFRAEAGRGLPPALRLTMRRPV